MKTIFLIAIAFMIGVFVIPPNQPISGASNIVAQSNAEQTQTASFAPDAPTIIRTEFLPSGYGKFTGNFTLLDSFNSELTNNINQKVDAYRFASNPGYLFGTEFNLPPRLSDLNLTNRRPGRARENSFLSYLSWRNNFGGSARNFSKPGGSEL